MTDFGGKYIERPQYSSNYFFEDKECLYIAETLKAELEHTFQDATNNQPIVKSIYTTNELLIPLQNYPVLKVYKVNETQETFPYVFTDFNVIYALAFTPLNKIIDISTAVGKEIRRILHVKSLSGNIQLEESTPITVQYQEYITPNDTIHKYVTVSFKALTSDLYDNNLI